MEVIVFKIANVPVAIGKGVGALAVAFIVFKLTNVYLAIGVGDGA